MFCCCEENFCLSAKAEVEIWWCRGDACFLFYIYHDQSRQTGCQGQPVGAISKGKGKKPRWCWIVMKQPIMLLSAPCVKWKMCLCEWEVERKIDEQSRLSELFREVVLDASGERGVSVCLYVCVCLLGIEATDLDWGCIWIKKFTERWHSEKARGIDSNFLFKVELKN